MLYGVCVSVGLVSRSSDRQIAVFLILLSRGQDGGALGTISFSSISIPEELSASAETVVQGLDSCLGDACIACLTQTRRTSWQVTVKSVEAKHRLLTEGFQVKGTYVSCMSIEPDVVFVTVKMPFEMADTPIRTILCTYGIVTSVRRLTYSSLRRRMYQLVTNL